MYMMEIKNVVSSFRIRSKPGRALFPYGKPSLLKAGEAL
jgi:hypothetical protein